MIDALELTDQERHLLKSIVLSAVPSESVGEVLKRTEWRGKLFAGALIAGVIAIILALYFWRQWLFSPTGIMSVVLYFFVAEEIRAIIRFCDERVRDRVIRKLYSALEGKELGAHSQDRRG